MVHGLVALIRVHVGVTAPAETGAVHFNLNARARCDRPPSVQALVVQSGYKITKTLRANRHAAANSLGPRHIDLIDVNDQLLAIPLQTARSDLEFFGTAMIVPSSPLGHGPTLAAFAVQSHIQGAEIFWISHTPLKSSGKGVIRRKNTPDKSDDGQTIFAIVT